MSVDNEKKLRTTITIDRKLKKLADEYAEREGFGNIPDSQKIIIIITRLLKIDEEQKQKK